MLDAELGEEVRRVLLHLAGENTAPNLPRGRAEVERNAVLPFLKLLD